MELRGRLLGLDVGTVRIGVAVSDPFRLTAFGLEYLDGTDLEKTFRRLDELLAEYEPVMVIVGLPLNMKGTDSAQTLQVREFIVALEVHLTGRDIPVETWDERLTTAQAERVLIDAGTRRKKRRQVKDQLAAALMLQGYIEAHPAG
jgi:putative holliday junction resolvase